MDVDRSIVFNMLLRNRIMYTHQSLLQPLKYILWVCAIVSPCHFFSEDIENVNGINTCIYIQYIPKSLFILHLNIFVLIRWKCVLYFLCRYWRFMTCWSETQHQITLRMTIWTPMRKLLSGRCVMWVDVVITLDNSMFFKIIPH